MDAPRYTAKEIEDGLYSGMDPDAELVAALYYDRLAAENAELKRDADRGRYMLKHGSWYRNDDEKQTRMAVLVPYGNDLSCYATREAAIDAAMKEQT